MLALALLALTATASAAPPPVRPNILFLLVDDMVRPMLKTPVALGFRA